MQGLCVGKATWNTIATDTCWQNISSSWVSVSAFDISGRLQVPSLGGSAEISLTDDFSRYTWPYPMQRKSDTFLTFQEWLLMVQRQTGRLLKIFRSDNGGEFVSNAFTQFLSDNGIVHQLIVPYTQQQNGVAERKNQTLMGMTRSMLLWSGLSSPYWAEVVVTATYILNRLTT